MFAIRGGDHDSGFEMISGARSDGSKRRMVDEDQEDRRRLAQLPLKSSVGLPKGVKSLEMWGDTLIASGKCSDDDENRACYPGSTMVRKFKK